MWNEKYFYTKCLFYNFWIFDILAEFGPILPIFGIMAWNIKVCWDMVCCCSKRDVNCKLRPKSLSSVFYGIESVVEKITFLKYYQRSRRCEVSSIMFVKHHLLKLPQQLTGVSTYSSLQPKFWEKYWGANLKNTKFVNVFIFLGCPFEIPCSQPMDGQRRYSSWSFVVSMQSRTTNLIYCWNKGKCLSFVWYCNYWTWGKCCPCKMLPTERREFASRVYPDCPRHDSLILLLGKKAWRTG